MLPKEVNAVGGDCIAMERSNKNIPQSMVII